MKFSEQWLTQWVPNLDSPTLAQKLTMAGLEVESRQSALADFSGIIIGEIMVIAPHPHLEGASICEINIGEEDTFDIITSAHNIKPLQKVAVALGGAILAGNIIKIETIGGLESKGRLCTAADLGLPKQEGLLELSPDRPVGDDLHHHLHVDYQLEISITPNRGDCLSIRGLAREIAALTDSVLTPIPYFEITPTSTTILPLDILAEEACPRYLGRVIEGINTQVATPRWIEERLNSAGLHAIHPVVDVCNYVMLELGQPMHAFDRDVLNHGVIVRFAKQGEKILLLNENILELTSKDLVIADQHGPVALAGIMGGRVSGVGPTTRNLFLESAFFTPAVIAETARRYHLTSDATQRYERGVDPELAVFALERATELLLAVVGGQVGPRLERKSERFFPRPACILLRRARIEKLLGCSITDREIQTHLAALNLHAQEQSEGWRVEVPSYRFDLCIEEDLIEEIARLYGYDRIPARLPKSTLSIKPQSEARVDPQRFSKALVDRGYFEVITYSFISPSMLDWFEAQPTIQLTNPISAEMAVMRPTLCPGLIETLRYNLNRQVDRARLFEKGRRYTWRNDRVHEETVLAGLVAGPVEPEQWGLKAQPVDFFTVKGDLESLFALGGETADYTFKPAVLKGLHPERSALIEKQGVPVGYLGALHPGLATALDLSSLPVYLFELALEPLLDGQLSAFKPISCFPALRRDLAVLVDSALPVGILIEKVGKKMSNLVQSVHLFDVYTGQGIPEGKKSLALSLILQGVERTLVDEEVNAVVDKVIALLKHEFGAQLR